MQPNKKFKVPIIGLLEETESLLTKNAPLENVPKKLGRALSPLIRKKSKRKLFFLRRTSLTLTNNNDEWGWLFCTFVVFHNGLTE